MTILAVILYLLVVTCALFAAHNAVRFGMAGRDRTMWLAVAAAFGLLVVLRVAGIEEILRDNLRDLLRSQGIYHDRREIQRPLAAVSLVVAGAIGWLALYSWPGLRSRSRICLWLAAWAAAGYVPLYTLRVLSLHAVDALLYQGPVRLNWVLDGALALLTGGAALAYVVFTRQGVRRRQAQEARERERRR